MPLVRPNAIAKYAELLFEQDLLDVLKRFGYGEQRDHPSYKICVALYDCGEPKPNCLAFRKDDEMQIGFWDEKRMWSVAYVLREPRDPLTGRRKWGIIPNPYVRVIDYWKREEMQ